MGAEPEGEEMSVLEKIKVTAVGRDGEPVELDLEIRAPSPCSIRAWQDEVELGEFSSEDLFNCMIAFRELLESAGLLLCCQGARHDVFPSGMDRQMGDGRHAHVLSPKPVREELRVDIFAPADPSAVSTVDEQRYFVLDYHGVKLKRDH